MHLSIDVLLIVLYIMCRSDVAYFDGLNETILSVALVRPKPGLFSNLFVMDENSLLLTAYVCTL